MGRGTRTPGIVLPTQVPSARPQLEQTRLLEMLARLRYQERPLEENAPDAWAVVTRDRRGLVATYAPSAAAAAELAAERYLSSAELHTVVQLDGPPGQVVTPCGVDAEIALSVPARAFYAGIDLRTRTRLEQVSAGSFDRFLSESVGRRRRWPTAWLAYAQSELAPLGLELRPTEVRPSRFLLMLREQMPAGHDAWRLSAVTTLGAVVEVLGALGRLPIGLHRVLDLEAGASLAPIVTIRLS